MVKYANCGDGYRRSSQVYLVEEWQGRGSRVGMADAETSELESGGANFPLGRHRLPAYI